MTTKSPNIPDGVKEEMKREAYEQIRQTAVDTLHPAGIPAERRHPDAHKDSTRAWAPKDKDAREMLTKVLLILRNGLKLYDAGQKAHVDDHGQDVIRALAHGGRVVIDIPALTDGQSPYDLTDFLGATQPVPHPRTRKARIRPASSAPRCPTAASQLTVRRSPRTRTGSPESFRRRANSLPP